MKAKISLKLIHLIVFILKDASAVDLQYALVQLAATAARLPNGTSHLWTYVFCPENIEGSHLCGNMVDR